MTQFTGQRPVQYICYDFFSFTRFYFFFSVFCDVWINNLNTKDTVAYVHLHEDY